MTLSQLSPSASLRHLLVRGGVALAMSAVGLVFGGCASYTAAGNVDLFVAQSPLPTLVPRGEVMAAAEAKAATHEGDFVLRGFGGSMEPVYVDGTAVVVHPTAMHMLRAGMAVVYRNARGANVTHMLLERTERGWRAIGLHNAEPDDVLVTERNLVGIVKHAFAADEAAFPANVAADIATNSALARGATMALLH